MGMTHALRAAIRGLSSIVPELLALAGAGLVCAVAWDVDPRLGKLVSGLILLYAARQLARTAPAEPTRG